MAEEAPRPGGDPETRFEAWVQETARTFVYPPVPARRTARPRTSQAKLVWVLVALLALAAVAAGVAQFIQIGGVRVWFTPPTSSSPISTPTTSVLDLQGETTFAEAQEKAGFTLLLPAYPADLGDPQRVFYQELGGAPVVVLVWLNADGSVRLSLHQLGPGTELVPVLNKANAFDKEILSKYGYELVDAVLVGNEFGMWVEGERLLISGSGEVKSIRLVNSPALIWENLGITYRLEGNFSLEEMVRIAESLK